MTEFNPEIMSWARETAGLTLEQAAKRLQIQSTKNQSPKEQLVALENGVKKPSSSILRRMAKQYHRPLITFYRVTPPRPSDYGVDFRKSSSEISEEQAGRLSILVREVFARQGVVKDLLREDGEDEVSLVGSLSLADGQHKAVEIISNIVEGTNKSTGPIRDFKKLRGVVEQAGVFVLVQGDLGSHHTTMDTSTFRGFAIADRLAPFIVINNNDAKTAKAFTLLHELAHLLLGDTGISGLDTEVSEERFCNDVASEYLLPSGIVQEIDVSSNDLHSLVEIIGRFSEKWKVSGTLIAYRLYRNGQLNYSQFKRIAGLLYRHWLEHKKHTRPQNAFIPITNKVKHRVGSALVRVVQRGIDEGILSTTRAALVLEVAPIDVGRVIGRPQ